MVLPELLDIKAGQQDIQVDHPPDIKVGRLNPDIQVGPHHPDTQVGRHHRDIQVVLLAHKDILVQVDLFKDILVIRGVLILHMAAPLNMDPILAALSLLPVDHLDLAVRPAADTVQVPGTMDPRPTEQWAILVLGLVDPQDNLVHPDLLDLMDLRQIFKNFRIRLLLWRRGV